MVSNKNVVRVCIYTRTDMHINGCMGVRLLIYLCVFAPKMPLCISDSGNSAEATRPGKAEGKAEGEQVVGKGSDSFSFSGRASEANTFLLF